MKLIAADGAQAFGVLQDYHGNDSHHWSRERIADWLEKQGY